MLLGIQAHILPYPLQIIVGKVFKGDISTQLSRYLPREVHAYDLREMGYHHRHMAEDGLSTARIIGIPSPPIFASSSSSGSLLGYTEAMSISLVEDATIRLVSSIARHIFDYSTSSSWSKAIEVTRRETHLHVLPLLQSTHVLCLWPGRWQNSQTLIPSQDLDQRVMGLEMFMEVFSSCQPSFHGKRLLYQLHGVWE